MGALFYQQALETVVPVSSTRVAEMVKLLENTFRMINIGLVNEIAMMCDRMGINVWEVIDAAATKPFGFMPFYPGPGLGGHCIPIDPFYLSWKTKQAGIEARFIELAGYINGHMPHFVVDKIQNALNDHSKPLKGSRVHVLGVAYKRDIDDVRESPALDIIHLLGKRGASVTYSDPYVPQLRADGVVPDMAAIDADKAAAEADCVVIVTDHKGFDYTRIVEKAKLIVDTRNALKANTLRENRAAVKLFERPEFFLGLRQHREIAVGVLPHRKERLIGGFRFSGVSRQSPRPAHAQIRKSDRRRPSSRPCGLESFGIPPPRPRPRCGANRRCRADRAPANRRAHKVRRLAALRSLGRVGFVEGPPSREPRAGGRHSIACR